MVISDSIPDYVTHLNVTSSGADVTVIGDSVYEWAVEDLNAGESGIITITGEISTLASDSIFTNTVTMTADESDILSSSAGVLVQTDTQPDISVSPSLLNFGDQDINSGATVSQDVIISNAGSENLAIYSVTLAGADASQFNVVDDTGEILLLPGNSRTVEINFDPSTTGGKTSGFSNSIRRH